jgi:crossover junction endodeoxyribonuclease RuvC
MRIMGIDPGTITAGYGVIEADGDDISPLCYNAIQCNGRSPIGERLSIIHAELVKAIASHQPDAVAVEHPFVAKNAKTALAIGKAQAVAILAATNVGLPVFEYSPRQIKLRVTGYGGSSKEQVQEMVRLQLNLKETPQPADAADALAVAICHTRELHLENLLS